MSVDKAGRMNDDESRRDAITYGMHGPRLSGREFDQRVAALYSGSSALSRADEWQRQRQELALQVARRLGSEFPTDRLEALWQASARVQRRRLTMIFWALIDRLRPGALNAASGRLAQYLRREYGTVLTPDELDQFLADAPGDRDE